MEEMERKKKLEMDAGEKKAPSIPRTEREKKNSQLPGKVSKKKKKKLEERGSEKNRFFSLPSLPLVTSAMKDVAAKMAHSIF